MNRNARKSGNRKPLAGAIVAALALGSITTANAGDAVYTLSPGFQAVGLTSFLHSLDNHQFLSGTVTPLAFDNNIDVAYVGTGAPITHSDNAIAALAGGNVAANALDLATLGSDAFNEGLGLTNAQLTDGATVRAIASASSIDTTLTDYAAGTVIHSSNSIEASSTINGASNQVAGALPDSFDGEAAGSIDFGYITPTSANLASTASVAISNAQAAVNSGAGGPTSAARVIDASITVSDTASVANAAQAVDVVANGNSIAAAFAGNQADNGFDATSGTRFTGSVSLANAQGNLNTAAVGGNQAAAVRDSVIAVAMNSTLDGAVSLSDNALSASAQGNDADNLIRFAAGTDVQGTGDRARVRQQVGPGSSVGGDAIGDLLLFNEQGNQNVTLDTRVSGDSAIRATAWHLDAGSVITANDNAIGSSSGGNQASSNIVADATSFSANTAAGSQQTNDNTSVTSLVAGTMIVAGVLGDLTSAAGGLDDVSGGSVVVNGNDIAASAQGNQAQTTVDLQGDNFDVFKGVFEAHANTSDGGNVGSGLAGVAVSNVQANFGADTLISARVSGAADAFGVHGGWIGAYYNGGIAGATSTANDNAVSAAAGGNDASSTIALAGTNGDLSARLANSQYNQSRIDAQVNDALVGVYLGGGSVTDSAVTVSGNALAATASSNTASNSVGTDFVNLTVGGNVANDWSEPSSKINDTGESSQAKGALAIASTQKSDADVSAVVDSGFTGVDVGEHPWPGVAGMEPERGNVVDSMITVAGNSSSASAIANSVDNSVAVGSGNLSTGSGVSEQIASLTNLQQETGNDVTATVSTTGPDIRELEQIGLYVHRNADGMSASITGNGINAFAGGNMADNAVTFGGTNYTPDSTLNGSAGLISMNDGAVSAGFALQNQQYSTGGTRTAEVANGNIGINLTDGDATDPQGQVTDSALTVNSNAVSADARDNYASNRIGLGVSYNDDGSATVDSFATLHTTAALQNSQSSGASVTSNVSGLVGVIAGHYDVTGSTISISDNAVASKAVNNTAVNRLDVAAGQLTGDSYADGFPFRGAASYGDDAVLADYALANSQSVMGSTTQANLNGVGIGVGIGEGNLDGGSVAITGNTQTALAQLNSAASSINLLATQADTSAALYSRQLVDDGSAVATAITPAGGLGFAAQVLGSVGATEALPITVSGNTLLAQAGLNDASNLLYVTADSEISGSVGPALAVTLPIFGNITGALAYYSLLNTQSASGNATATVSPGLSGIEVVGMEANGTSSTIGNGNGTSHLTVSDNHFTAQANANSASNAVTLDGAASIGATAALVSQQQAEGTVTATLGDADIGIYNRDSGQPQGGAISNAAATVSDNSLTARANGNSASNALLAQPVALNATVATPTFAVGVSGFLDVALANYVVLNGQSNSAAVSSSISNSSIGLNNGARGSASQMLDSVAMVGGNSALASSMGNSASNSITLAATAGGMASSALVSNQVNTAAISATVSNVSIGVTAGQLGALSNSPVTVTGNSITASAVGNSAVNQIGIGD